MPKNKPAWDVLQRIIDVCRDDIEMDTIRRTAKAAKAAAKAQGHVQVQDPPDSLPENSDDQKPEPGPDEFKYPRYHRPIWTFFGGNALLFFLFSLAAFGSLCTPNVADAQVGKDSGYWDFVLQAPHRDVTVSVRTPAGYGAGVVIQVGNKAKTSDEGVEGYFCYIATAAHLFRDLETGAAVKSGDISVVYRNGAKSRNCSVAVVNTSIDTAIVWAWMPEQLLEAANRVKIAASPAQPGDSITVSGYGGTTDVTQLRSFLTKCTIATDGETVYCDAVLVGGDSGGPVWNADNELLGVVSGGWIWLDTIEVKRADKSSVKVTWPGKTSNLESLKRCVSKIPNFEAKNPHLTRTQAGAK